MPGVRRGSVYDAEQFDVRAAEYRALVGGAPQHRDILDDLDLQLLHALQLDGRAAFSRIAQVLGVSARTVARRYGRLQATGLVHVAGVASTGPTGSAEW